MAAVLLLLGGLCPRVCAQQTWGRIEIPARTLIDLEEATVEAWVLFEFDPLEQETGVWRGTGTWFNFEIPRTPTDLGASVNLSYGLKNSARPGKPPDSRCYQRVGFVFEGQEVPHPALPECKGFKRDEWHHVAVTWREGKYLRIYFDGQEAAARDFPFSVRRDIPSTARIVLGATGYVRQNAVAIDELRISSIARRSEDLGFFACPLSPDPFTLYLDGFENVVERDGKRFTAPTVVANVFSPKEYEITGGRIREGKVGKAFAFDWRGPQVAGTGR